MKRALRCQHCRSLSTLKAALKVLWHLQHVRTNESLPLECALPAVHVEPRNEEGSAKGRPWSKVVFTRPAIILLHLTWALGPQLLKFLKLLQIWESSSSTYHFTSHWPYHWRLLLQVIPLGPFLIQDLHHLAIFTSLTATQPGCSALGNSATVCPSLRTTP